MALNEMTLILSEDINKVTTPSSTNQATRRNKEFNTEN